MVFCGGIGGVGAVGATGGAGGGGGGVTCATTESVHKQVSKKNRFFMAFFLKIMNDGDDFICFPKSFSGVHVFRVV
jgi:hypothetical protein